MADDGACLRADEHDHDAEEDGVADDLVGVAVPDGEEDEEGGEEEAFEDGGAGGVVVGVDAVEDGGGGEEHGEVVGWAGLVVVIERREEGGGGRERGRGMYSGIQVGRKKKRRGERYPIEYNIYS
jgi:hypothetical protein